MIGRECTGVLIRSVLPAASYIYTKTLLHENLFLLSIAQAHSSITVSFFPNHTINYPTHLVPEFLDLV